MRGDLPEFSIKLDFEQRKAALELEGYCNQFPDEAAHSIIGLRAQKAALLEAAKQAQCACTIRERDSGHKVECWMPTLLDAIAAAELRSAAQSRG